jgi:hypothetical protein
VAARLDYLAKPGDMLIVNPYWPVRPACAFYNDKGGNIHEGHSNNVGHTKQVAQVLRIIIRASLWPK